MLTRSKTARHRQTDTGGRQSIGRIGRTTAAAGVLLLLIPYTVYFWFDPAGVAGVVLGFIPGLVAVGILLAAGFALRECNLQVARITRRGLLVLVALTPLLAVILTAGEWSGWDLGYALQAALSGISQELYFRAALLPVAVWLFPARLWWALGVHAGLFVAWHLHMFMEAPLVAWVPIIIVLFLTGFGWGWQVHHDRTIVWTMLQHSLFLIAMSLLGLA
jgi:hypothetical protein